MKTKKIPMRTCVGCRTVKPKAELVRIVRTPDGAVKPDKTGKLSGRGVYICRDEACLEKSIRTKALSRALDTPIPDETAALLHEELHG
ncbi:MAG: YlxR family protein [Clostridia bacterium]|nr:YlxR family protein [Clostridia bacterium]